MHVFYHIVTLRHGEAKPVRDLLGKGKVKQAVKFMAQWDYGNESEHSPTESRFDGYCKTRKVGKYWLVTTIFDDDVTLLRRERVRRA